MHVALGFCLITAVTCQALLGARVGRLEEILLHLCLGHKCSQPPFENAMSLLLERTTLRQMMVL